MPWLQLKLDTSPALAEQLSELLNEAGALAVTLQDAEDQPLYEPPPGTAPLWQHTRVIGLFPGDADLQVVVTGLQAALGRDALAGWHADPLEDQDWTRSWMDSFQPLCFGERLWIVPSWHTPPNPGAVNILLDPGLAFGTGTHATTALCLNWLDGHGADHACVIDYGCGSGILAIAAAKLGAQQVWAVDTDPQALLATRDNAHKNGVADRINAVLPGDLPGDVRAPLLLANILANPLMELAPQFAQRVSPGGHVVLSGILAEQAEAVVTTYQPWFDMQPPVSRDDWVRLEGLRK